MDFLTVLLLSLAVSPVTLLPPQQPTIIEGKGRKTIPEINQGLNLQGGDIKQDKNGVEKSAILGDKYRWTDKYIPYVFNNISMNDKGVILRSFEQMRLKSCVDFVPRSNEEDYVSIETLEGCWSAIGKQGGMQQLSIGVGCAFLSTVQHEFLHCLGFNHEQSRYDRDYYVEIINENIEQENLHNFEIESEQVSTVQETLYDFTSVMHYGQKAFSKGDGITIITKEERFQNVIGQEYDLSPLDSYELSKLYNCSESISFLDHCSFEYNICEMSTCNSEYNYSWRTVSMAIGGPDSDHSRQPSLGVPTVSMTNGSSDPSFFMHLSSINAREGISAVLESKHMTPKRSCNIQCLEFFYYHSASETDQLNIWIREYENTTDLIGTIRLMDQITGPPTDHWQLHYVPLDASGPFVVEIEGRKGAGYSIGGFSIDDINFVESECPHNIWQIRNFMEALNSTSDPYMYSPLFYSPDGYRYQAVLWMNNDSITVSVRLVSGVNDDYLHWPCPWRQVTFVLLDQNPDIQQRMSSQDSLTTNPEEMFEDRYLWGRPSEVGTPFLFNDETLNVTEPKAFNIVLKKERLNDREFVKGGDLILLFSMQDISGLQTSDTLLCPTVISNNDDFVTPYPIAENGPCFKRIVPTSAPTPSECLDIFCSSANIVHPSVALLLALILLLVNY